MVRTLALCTAFPLLATAVLAQRVPEIEPNDTPAQAQAILPGQQIVASFATTTDEEWFSFTLTSPGQAHLRSINAGTLALNLTRDTRIALYDATGTTRLAWNDTASGSRADCGVTLPAGSYLYRVGLKTAITAAVAYDLDFFVQPSDPIDTVEGPEPNDPTVGGGVATPFVLGDTLEGNLSSPTDVDFWTFTVPNRGLPQAVTFDDGGIPQLDNLALRFWQETAPGTWTALGTGVATNSASHRVTNLNLAGLFQAGTYAVAVSAGTAATGTAPWDLYKVGQYSLRTRWVDMAGANSFPEAPEPNGTTATAGALNLGDDASGSAQAGNDPDWYAFAISGPTTICAMAEGTGATPLPGSTLRIWDANGATVGSASGGATTHGRLIATITAPGIYYLEIAAAQFAMTGDYVLHTGGVAPLYVQAATRVEPASTNACVGSTGDRPLLGFMGGETAAFGSNFVTRLDRALPNSFGALLIGLSNTLAFGTLPLPVFLDWGGLDAQGNPSPCYARVDPALILLVLTDATGSADFDYSFPYLPGNIGGKIYLQALCFDPSLNGFGFSVSNDASYVLGDLPF